jgi:hypothetical protein
MGIGEVEIVSIGKVVQWKNQCQKSSHTVPLKSFQERKVQNCAIIRPIGNKTQNLGQ